jgi:hypothetical protein
MASAFATTLATVITATAGPSWRLLAETNSPASDAARITPARGLKTIAAVPSRPTWLLRALIECPRRPRGDRPRIPGGRRGPGPIPSEGRDDDADRRHGGYEHPQAISTPSVYQRERKRTTELQSGLRQSTAGLSTAPRCL